MMRNIQLGVEGGCSTSERPVFPVILDQKLGKLVIICTAHPPEEGVAIERGDGQTDQEQLDSFCRNCPLNRQEPLGEATPPPFQ